MVEISCMKMEEWNLLKEFKKEGREMKENDIGGESNQDIL
jgi:hypothetical protein